MAYEAFILLPPDTEASIEEARRKLEKAYSRDARDVRFETAEDQLTVTIDGWNLYIYLNSEPYVSEASKELAELYAKQRPDKNEIAASGLRFEIAGDDDVEMDHFNDYFRTLEHLSEFRAAKVWESAGEQFTN